MIVYATPDKFNISLRHNIYIEKNTFNIEKFLDIFERIRNFGKFSTMAFRNTYANTLKKSRLYLIKQVKQDPFLTDFI